MKLLFSTIFGGAFILGMLLAGPVAHAELSESVTCGKITSFEADKVRMKIGVATYVIEKAHLPPHTKVPSEICLQADRLPAAEVPEGEDAKFPLLMARPIDSAKFVHPSESERNKMEAIARQHGVVFVGLPNSSAEARPDSP